MFTCRVSRAVYLDLAENVTSKEFINGFKRLLERAGQNSFIQIMRKHFGMHENG